MTSAERLSVCSNCKNRGFNPQTGLICKLSSKIPDFESECADYVHDQNIELARQLRDEIYYEENEVADEPHSGYISIIFGVVFAVLAIVWFVAGWTSGVIFFYPPILFIAGLAGIIRGIAKEIKAGKRRAAQRAKSKSNVIDNFDEDHK